jgi:hypothetical protein
VRLGLPVAGSEAGEERRGAVGVRENSGDILIANRGMLAVMFLMIAVLMAAACIGLLENEDKISGVADSNKNASEYLVMDANTYNQGEVIEFYLINSGSERLRCGSINPYFSVSYKLENGDWGYAPREPGPLEAIPIQPMPTYMKPGESTPVYRLITNDWKPGLYRISFNCNRPVRVTNRSGESAIEYQSIYQDFILREKPNVTTP